MKELKVQAHIDELPQVLAFVDEQLEPLGCSIKTTTQIDVALEEIFINIVNYAYAPNTGTAVIRSQISGDPAILTVSFMDSGTPYDPLAKPDPNVSKPLRERQKGGLGIFLVKKTMDEMHYEYKEGHNILTLKKKLI